MRKVIDEKAAYLDTCVVSGLARNDINASESEPMVAMLGDADNGSFRFVTSSVVLDELNRIPKEHQTTHLAIYHLLAKVRALPEPSITRMGLHGGPAANPDRLVWARIKAIVPGENDANHLYQAFQNGIRFFVTVDEATILRYKSKINRELDIIACKPSELFQISGGANNYERVP